MNKQMSHFPQITHIGQVFVVKYVYPQLASRGPSHFPYVSHIIPCMFVAEVVGLSDKAVKVATKDKGEAWIPKSVLVWQGKEDMNIFRVTDKFCKWAVINTRPNTPSFLHLGKAC